MQREGKPGKEGASGAAQLAALAWMGGMTGSRSVSSYSLVQFPGHICVLAKNWAGGGGVCICKTQNYLVGLEGPQDDPVREGVTGV